MSDNSTHDDELAEFMQAVQGVRKLEQDTIRPAQQRINRKQSETPVNSRPSRQPPDIISDEYQPLLPEDGPMRYLREGAEPYLVKQLKRGDYPPELFLDLHGMRRTDAKSEILSLLQACAREEFTCAAVMYGHGEGILKRLVPAWLVQHPDVLAFHRAPREWGGASALLVLVGNAPLR